MATTTQLLATARPLYRRRAWIGRTLLSVSERNATANVARNASKISTTRRITSRPPQTAAALHDPSWRMLSTTTPEAATAAASTATKPSSHASDVFFDNLGKIFLAGIGLLVATLVRSYMGTSNRNAMRERMTEQASLDPLEIDDLRVANSELDLPVFQAILKDLTEAYPSNQSITYQEFVSQVRKTMKRLKGDAFTIQLGHLLDRVVLDILQDHEQTSRDPQPIALWMTVLSLALHSPVPERVQALFQVLQATSSSSSTSTSITGYSGNDDNDDAAAPIVTMKDARAMVGYLQASHQLVPDSQVVATPEKYPIQKYAKGKPEDLFEWDGNESDDIDVDAFAEVLQSSAVCAWGECYHRKKFSV